MAKLTERVIRAHGGSDRWAQVTEIMACVSMGGWDFTSRLHPRPLRDVEVTATTATPMVSISPYPQPGRIGFFTPQRVWVEDDNGRCLSERAAPGLVFGSLKRWLSWDDLDVLYYAGMLLWQTLNLPFLLLRRGLEVTELPPQQLGAERWHRLSVRYPDELVTLTSEQTVYADPTGLVHRLDFNAPHYGAWLGLSQLWEAHESFGGLIYPTRLVLHPCLINGQPWRMTALVWMELDDIGVISRAAVTEGSGGLASDPTA